MPTSYDHLRTQLAELRSSSAIEDQARTVLLLVLDGSDSDEALKVKASQCPNCGMACDARRTPYCSDACKETAAFVRQFRSALEDGVIFETERQVAMGQKLWHLLGGGYPLRLTLAPPSALKQVQKRTDGNCEICGNPAATYDHLGSG